MKVAAYEIARREANEVRAMLRRFVTKAILTDPQISMPRISPAQAGGC